MKNLLKEKLKKANKILRKIRRRPPKEWKSQEIWAISFTFDFLKEITTEAGSWDWDSVVNPAYSDLRTQPRREDEKRIHKTLEKNQG